MSTRLFVDGFLYRIFYSTDRVLNLASGLIRLALGFKLRVAGHFSRNFLYLTFNLLGAGFNAVLVHGVLFLLLLAMTTDGEGKSFLPHISDAEGTRGWWIAQKGDREVPGRQLFVLRS